MSDNLEPIIKNEAPKVEPTMMGIVSNCAKLNVRKKPTKAADVLGIINAGTEVTINDNKSTNTWYYVTTPNGIKGYCMRQYIVTE